MSYCVSISAITSSMAVAQTSSRFPRLHYLIFSLLPLSAGIYLVYGYLLSYYGGNIIGRMFVFDRCMVFYSNWPYCMITTEIKEAVISFYHNVVGVLLSKTGYYGNYFWAYFHISCSGFLEILGHDVYKYRNHFKVTFFRWTCKLRTFHSFK